MNTDRLLAVAGLALHENFPNQRGDRIDGVRHGKESHRL